VVPSIRASDHADEGLLHRQRLLRKRPPGAACPPRSRMGGSPCRAGLTKISAGRSILAGRLADRLRAASA